MDQWFDDTGGEYSTFLLFRFTTNFADLQNHPQWGLLIPNPPNSTLTLFVHE